jgi:dihydrofolate reductase
LRKIIAYLATSIDGFIARPDGAVDWLDRPRPRGNYGMSAFLRSVDSLVMGRATYDTGKELGGGVWPGKRNIILSRTLAPDSVKGAIVESGDAADLASRWRSEPGSDIWLMGGAVVFGEFLDAGAIDELIVHIVPVAIGTGIPLFDPKPRTSEMSLLSVKKFTDGVVRLHYAVGVALEGPVAVKRPLAKKKRKVA